VLRKPKKLLNNTATDSARAFYVNYFSLFSGFIWTRAILEQGEDLCKRREDKKNYVPRYDEDVESHECN